MRVGSRLVDLPDDTTCGVTLVYATQGMVGIQETRYNRGRRYTGRNISRPGRIHSELATRRSGAHLEAMRSMPACPRLWLRTLDLGNEFPQPPAVSGVQLAEFSEPPARRGRRGSAYWAVGIKAVSLGQGLDVVADGTAAAPPPPPSPGARLPCPRPSSTSIHTAALY